ncbi:TetR/AcrR family transcriptional regulator [Kineosporia succinea]|uniref:TetR/AcrR family transcriptional repressor of nem operon n=1 Tax=Kineosporia succinea TaxID=84632 RepID=A0ABT9PC17_9ACTN|nr:TetR/AcrR family transcriptional regulator [Kineosporia succinea]MDP9830245.1 TetR/AcrR family transcriptional repressor of nem operon [Kineosporia succinea]
MGRPRSFDEDEVIASAVALFASRAYDSVSVDDLVTHLGVHRNSLYKTFGSKRGLYLAALRRHVEQDVTPLTQAEAAIEAIEAGRLDLLLFAAVERAPVDTEVASLISRALTGLDAHLGAATTATALGRRVRARAGLETPPTRPPSVT